MGIRRKRGSTEATGEPIGHSWTLSAHSGAQHRTARGGLCVVPRGPQHLQWLVSGPSPGSPHVAGHPGAGLSGSEPSVTGPANSAAG